MQRGINTFSVVKLHVFRSHTLSAWTTYSASVKSLVAFDYA